MDIVDDPRGLVNYISLNCSLLKLTFIGGTWNILELRPSDKDLKFRVLSYNKVFDPNDSYLDVEYRGRINWTAPFFIKTNKHGLYMAAVLYDKHVNKKMVLQSIEVTDLPIYMDNATKHFENYLKKASPVPSLPHSRKP